MDNDLLIKTYEEITALKDLFLRRLLDDKVKMAAIAQLKDNNEALQKQLDDKNLISFIKELLLVCDRIEMQKHVDELTVSVKEELLDILARREFYQMSMPTTFNPVFHNAVGTVLETEEFPEKSVVTVIRNGYLYRDQVFRPADVIVAVKENNPTIQD